MQIEKKTKAKSRAARRRGKRGRPRIEGQPREPNGRISRAKKPTEPADALTLAMRAKHTRLSLSQAKDPRAETYIGRLAMAGREGGLSADQYDAALKYLELYGNYQRAIQSPAAYYDQAGTLADEESFEEWCAKIKDRYKAAMKAIQEAQFDNKTENLFAALQYVIHADLELPHMIGATRMLLNALHRHFFLVKRCH